MPRDDGTRTLLILQWDRSQDRCHAAAHPLLMETVMAMGMPRDAVFQADSLVNILDRMEEEWLVFVHDDEADDRITVTGLPNPERDGVPMRPDVDLTSQDVEEAIDDLVLQANPFIESLLADGAQRVAAGEDPAAVHAEMHERMLLYARQVWLDSRR